MWESLSLPIARREGRGLRHPGLAADDQAEKRQPNLVCGIHPIPHGLMSDRPCLQPCESWH
jgi:hypothetical protein